MLFAFMLLSLADSDRRFAEKLYADYKDYMYTIAINVLKNRHDAEDAVNDAMCKILKYLSKFQNGTSAEVCNMITLCIRSVVRNKALDHYKKRARYEKNRAEYYEYDRESGEYVEREFEDTEFDLEEEVIRKEECAIVRKSLHLLPEEQRDAVNLVYMCECSCVEAADILGVSAGVVRTRVHRARIKLREILEKELDYR